MRCANARRPRCVWPFALALPLAVACGAARPPVAEPPPPSASTESPPPPPPAAPPSLYERLGRKEGLSGLVEELMGDVLADNRIAALFDKARKEESKGRPLSARMVAQLCVVAGGDDCGYGGKSMTDAQSGMKITSAQWDAFVEDLGIALKTRSIDDATARELIDKLTQQTRADLVTKPGRP